MLTNLGSGKEFAGFFSLALLVIGCGSVTAASSSDAGDDVALEAPAAAGDVAGELGQVDAGGAELAPHDAAAELAPEAPAPALGPCPVHVKTGYRCSTPSYFQGQECLRCFVDPNDVQSDPAKDGTACTVSYVTSPAGIPAGICVRSCNDCTAN